jgi:hypothetical protein
VEIGKTPSVLECDDIMSNIYSTNYVANPDLKQPVNPSAYNVGLGTLASPSSGLANPPIPQWLVPIVGLIILSALATTGLFKPIAIVLVGIIALWLMNG